MVVIVIMPGAVTGRGKVLVHWSTGRCVHIVTWVGGDTEL
jgi:hypothetical protein